VENNLEGSLGAILRATRLAKQIDLKTVEQETKIRETYLLALEEDNYAVIPGDVYVRGFLNNYATFLGLDGKAFVQEYKARQQAAVEAAAAQETVEGKPLPRRKQKFESLASAGRKTGFKKSMVAVAVIVVVAAVGFLLSQRGDESATPSGAQDSTVTQQAGQSHQNGQAKPATTNNATDKPVAAGVKLVTQLEANCWFQVWQDDNVIYSGTLKAGEIKEWTAERQLKIRFGYPQGVKLIYNGKEIGYAGESAKPVTLSFDAAGNWQLVE